MKIQNNTPTRETLLKELHELLEHTMNCEENLFELYAIPYKPQKKEYLDRYPGACVLFEYTDRMGTTYYIVEDEFRSADIGRQFAKSMEESVQLDRNILKERYQWIEELKNQIKLLEDAENPK